MAFNALESGNDDYSQAAENIKQRVAKGAYKDKAVLDFKVFLRALLSDLKLEGLQVESLLSFDQKSQIVVGDNMTVKTEKLMELIVRPRPSEGVTQ
jgi:hypothetical protein